MAGSAMQFGNQFKPAFMPDKGPHAGGFTNDCNGRFNLVFLQKSRHLRGTETAHLFIKGKGVMQRQPHLAFRLFKERGQRQRYG